VPKEDHVDEVARSHVDCPHRGARRCCARRGAGWRRTLELKDPTAHAEMLVLREAAAKRNSERLADCDLYVSLEPCAMCAAAISFARIRRIYFGAGDEKMGAVEHGPRFFQQPTCHHKPEVYGGIGEREARELLQAFFSEKRKAAS
jgi:tRNA(adenine34) deaminase